MICVICKRMVLLRKGLIRTPVAGFCRARLLIRMFTQSAISFTEPSGDRYESSSRPHAMLPKLTPFYCQSYFLCVTSMELGTFLDLHIM